MIKSIKMLHLVRATKLDFMKLAKPAFAISWALIVIGMAYGFYRGKSAFGIDFLGGDTSEFVFKTKVGEDQVKGQRSPLPASRTPLSNTRKTSPPAGKLCAWTRLRARRTK